MPTCPLRRAFIDTGSGQCPARRPGDSARHWLHIAMTLSSLLGWRALTDLLDAIPDSNDDFGLF
ncbi:hypothetical protein [Paraburkholderia sp.]|uniref:hypothetical protein n=1 Tax=Paraburkholderia sp. TaxID=1926495 RepID=UPI0039E53626